MGRCAIHRRPPLSCVPGLILRATEPKKRDLVRDPSSGYPSLACLEFGPPNSSAAIRARPSLHLEGYVLLGSSLPPWMLTLPPASPRIQAWPGLATCLCP
jgi:hypothetical protein